MLTDKPQISKGYIKPSGRSNKTNVVISPNIASPKWFAGLTGEKGGATPQDLRQSRHLQKTQMPACHKSCNGFAPPFSPTRLH